MAPVFVVSHRGALGDFALTWPALRALRGAHPRHRFLGLGRPGHLELAIALGLLDAGLDAESASLLPFYQGLALPPALEGVDAALLWLREDDAARRLLRAFPGPAALHPPFPEGAGTHVLEHHLAALDAFGAAREAASALSPFRLDVAREPDLILLHPGSGSPAKNHRREFYAGLAPLLAAGWGRGMRVEIVLGPAEEGQGAFWRDRFAVVEPRSPLALARRLASAALYVGNDSGPAHVAALLGTPTLALFKSTDPAVWGVRGPVARSVFAATEEQARINLRTALDSLRFGTNARVSEERPPAIS